MKKYYLPAAVAARAIWLQTFSAQCATRVGTLGIVAGDVTVVGNFSAYYNYLVSYNDQLKDYGQDITEYIRLAGNGAINNALAALDAFSPTAFAGTVPTNEGGFKFINALVRRIKAHSNYDESIGQAMGILGADTDFDGDTYTPAIESKVVGDDVKSITTQPHPIEGFYWEIKVNDAADWSYAGHTTHPAFTDHRPLAVAGKAEKRQYRVWGEVHDLRVGNPSLPTTVFVGQS